MLSENQLEEFLNQSKVDKRKKEKILELFASGQNEATAYLINVYRRKLLEIIHDYYCELERVDYILNQIKED